MFATPTNISFMLGCGSDLRQTNKRKKSKIKNISLSWQFQSGIKVDPGLHRFCRTLLRDRSRKLALSTQPIKCKMLKPVATWSLAFSRALGSLPALNLSFHWLVIMSTFVLTGRCGYISTSHFDTQLKTAPVEQHQAH